MSYSNIIAAIAGLLQFGVACYTLRLARLFSKPRAGWQLFGALSVLATLCFLILPFSPLRNGIGSGGHVDLVYSVISLLLLAGMAHIELNFKDRLQAENKQREVQSQWGTQMEQEWQSLNKNHEELRHAAKHEVMKLTQANEALQQTVRRLEFDIAEHKRLQVQSEATALSMALAARQAGMTELAGRLLEELNQLDVSLDRQASFTRTQFARSARPARKSGATVESSRSRTPRGRKLPDWLAHLAQSLTDEQSRFTARIAAVRQQLARFSAAGSAQEQSAGNSVAPDAAIKAAPPAESYCGQTETATTQESAGAASEAPASPLPEHVQTPSPA